MAKPKGPEAKPGVAMRKYALQQASVLLRRFAFEAGRTSRRGDPDSIHDLRVSIRRLTHCLRLFRQFFPGGKAKTVRRGLKTLMSRAAGVRNRDVALVLLQEAGIDAASPLLEKLVRERASAHRQLLAALARWDRHHSFRKWRAELGV
jgi:CHAD domain-containing protein